MKILVFSDSHLTDKFEEKKFNFLKKIISCSDFVIINGDFWDGELTTFDKFLFSKWNKLFPLLKAKNTVYIYGNHDRKSYSDKRVNLFSVYQAYNYRLDFKEKIYIIEHGNRILRTIDESLPRFITRYTTLFAGLLLQNLSFLQLILKRANRVIKKRAIIKLKKNEIIVCGHSHWAEIDLKNKFINTGSIENGVGKYLNIEEGTAFLKSENYF